MTTVKVKVDKKLFDLVTERLPGLGYASPEDFVRHAVDLRFETLLGLIAMKKPRTKELPVDNETYAKLEAKAKEKSQSVDEYVVDLIHTFAKELED